MPSCFIIDDEAHAIEVLSDYVTQTPGLQLLGAEKDPVAGLQKVRDLKPDILFLDVDMPKLTGLDLFALLGDTYTVVFTTAYAGYAVEAFDVAAADFLLKPIRYSRFLQCVEKLAARPQPVPVEPAVTANDFIFLQSGNKGKVVKFRFADIRYAESYHNYVVVHQPGETFTVYLSLKELMSRLPADTFIRIHKSYLINYQQIKFIEGNRVFLADMPELPIGKEYREDFLALVQGDTVKKK